MKPEHSAGKKIVIVGAGPAGLSAALYLKRQGYTDVTVLEKLGRVGGLCKTITQDYENFDLGANYVTPAFKEVLKLAKEYKAEMYGERNGAAVELPPEGEPIWRDIWDAVRGDMSNFAFLKKCAKYAWLRYKLRPVIDKPGFAGVSLHPEVCVSFNDWLIKNDLECLQTLFEAPITIMGYGYIRCPQDHDDDHANLEDREIPAPHALKYMSLLTFINLVGKLTPVFRWVPWPKRFLLGYQRLWEVVSFKLNVEKNINIESITRTGKDKKITVNFRRQQQAGADTKPSELRTLEYDTLIVACPLEASVIGGFLEDMTDEEHQLFGHVISYSYNMTSCHVEDFKLREPIVATLPLAPVGTPWAITRQYANSDMIQFYSRVPVGSVNYAPALKEKMGLVKLTPALENPGYANEQAADASTTGTTQMVKLTPANFLQDHQETKIDPEVQEFVCRIGGKIDTHAWKTFDRWPYFQHYRVQEISEGYYDRLEAMQGEMNTYYVGGLMNFELVNMIMVYSKHIVETHFPRVSPPSQ